MNTLFRFVGDADDVTWKLNRKFPDNVEHQVRAIEDKMQTGHFE